MLSHDYFKRDRKDNFELAPSVIRAMPVTAVIGHLVLLVAVTIAQMVIHFPFDHAASI